MTTTHPMTGNTGVTPERATSLSDRLREPRYISDEDHARTPDAVLTTLQEFRRERSEAADKIDQLVEGLREAVTALTCRDDDAHYCPNCDNSLFNIRAKLSALIASVEGGE